ncbi:hypothetical protein G7067_08155 [Leucobacter insecticola]|uniref:DUF6993 domain-containing protein n=1 Tax=Leucobacter insecticola TaxID=2714934 RepID=A0A6G8FLV0_9MICO|nr:hypothetical protein G7067_08155 [Leucobacter insecticola]
MASNRKARAIRAARVALALAATLPLLAGCALIEGPTPETPTRTEPPVPEVEPEFVPGGSAADNLPYFTEVLRKYAAGDSVIKGEPVAQRVVDAGFDPAAIQFSFDQSKTGLPADNIFVSVLIGPDCLIGQLVTGDRSFVVANEPAVGPEGNICLIGNTRSVDW